MQETYRKLNLDELFKGHIQNILDTYGQDHILGIFGIGQVNYGTIEKRTEFETVTVYLPSFEELCNRAEPLDTTITDNYGIKSHIKDIRYGYDLVYDQDTYFLQAMCSDYQYVNPSYFRFLHELKLRREEIYHANKKIRIEHALEEAFEALDRYNDKRKPIDLFNACRLKIASQNYLNGEPIDECVKLTKDYQTKYLLSIKHTNTTINTDSLLFDLIAIKEKNKAEPSSVNTEISNFVKQKIKDIMLAAINETTPNAETLINGLSKTEIKCLQQIVKRLDSNDEATLVVSVFGKETNISYPVMKSLFAKLNNSRIAEVVNHGAKGTHIAIHSKELIYKMMEANNDEK